MHDKFKKRVRVGYADDRLKRQIATEAARRLLPRLCPDPANPRLVDISTLEYETAKRQAVAVLGQRIRPGDLPTDAEVRFEALRLRDTQPSSGAESTEAGSETDSEAPSDDEDQPNLRRIAEHLDRFAIFKIRLEPLHEVKLDPRWHPEGDALFHELQVFERAREVRPYDEEFLLAALLHEVGRAIDPNDRVNATLLTLEGTVSERTRWLIENLPELLPKVGGPSNPRPAYELRQSPWFDDLDLLAELDLAGRERGVQVGTIDDALTYIQSLESEGEG